MKFDNKIIYVLFVLSVLLYLDCTAQTRTVYSLEKCLEIAYSTNPSLKSIASQVAAAEAKKNEAWSNYFFSASVGGQAIYNSDFMSAELPLPGGTNRLEFGGHETYDFSVQVRQPLFTGFQIDQLNNIARLSLASEQQKEKYQKKLLKYLITISYFRMQLMLWYQEIAQTSKRQMQEHLTDISNRYQQGMTPKYEVMLVEYRLAEADQNIVQAANAMRLARTALNNHMGIAQDSSYSIVVDSVFIPQSYNLENLIAAGLQTRGDLGALRYREQQTDHFIGLQKGDWYPHLFAFGSYHYGKPGVNPIANEWMDYWSVGLSLQWNIWDWGRRQSKINQAQLQYKGIQYTRDKLQQDIEKDIIDAYVRVNESADLVNLVKKEVQQSEALFQYVRDNYVEGLVSNTDFIDRQLELTRARLKKAQSIAQYQIAVANLERAVGK